jgi:hypothetical protein
MSDEMGILASHPEVKAFLDDLLACVRAELGPELVGMYVDGSLAAGDFDRASDVDVVVVTESEIGSERLAALDALHQRVAQQDAWCATELECTYISRAALRRFDQARAVHPNLDRGPGERVKLMTYDEGWLVHCHLLRTRGITLAGPDPATLVDEVSPADLRAAMRAVLAGWATDLLSNSEMLGASGYQSYVVLSLCRIRYTFETGAVVSKRRAAEWARETVDARWHSLVERALLDRQRPRARATDEATRLTLEFIRDTCDAAQVDAPSRRRRP